MAQVENYPGVSTNPGSRDEGLQESVETDVGGHAGKRPAGDKADNSTKGAKKARTNHETTPEVIDLEEPQPELVTFTSPKGQITRVVKGQEEKFAREKLLEIYEEQRKNLRPGTALRSKVEDIIPVIGKADRATIINRHKTVWSKTLASIKKVLQQEQEVFANCYEYVWHKDAIKDCEPHLVDKPDRRVDQIIRDIAHENAVIKFLEQN